MFTNQLEQFQRIVKSGARVEATFIPNVRIEAGVPFMYFLASA